ncbi:MAG: TIM barrel protein [Halioglobus sp.]|nr:TIM barrel protein [Halioglobus sp.]
MVQYSIAQFTALNASPVDYIHAVAGAGSDRVSLLVNSPGRSASVPIVSDTNLAEVLQALEETGLGTGNVECFMLTPDTDVAAYEPALVRGARLGALGATVLIYDTDEARARKNLTTFFSLATQHGLRVSLEFLAMTPRWNNLIDAAALIRSCDLAGLGLGVDILHLIRSGGAPEDMAHIPAELIHYVQVCDSTDLRSGIDYAEEAAANRLMPGEGLFPITDFLQSLPAETLIEIEVPQTPPKPAAVHIADCLQAMRQAVANAQLFWA